MVPKRIERDKPKIEEKSERKRKGSKGISWGVTVTTPWVEVVCLSLCSNTVTATTASANCYLTNVAVTTKRGCNETVFRGGRAQRRRWRWLVLFYYSFNYPVLHLSRSGLGGTRLCLCRDSHWIIYELEYHEYGWDGEWPDTTVKRSKKTKRKKKWPCFYSA